MYTLWHGMAWHGMALAREGVASFPFDFKSAVGTIWMDDCGGRDQVVFQVCNQGWRSYEPPLPLLIAKVVSVRSTSFFDVGANTGFYSLIAANAGAVQVHAFEPVPVIADVMAANLNHNYRERSCPVKIHRYALADHNGKAELFIPHQGHGLLETSCSLNPDFRAQHSGSIQVNLCTLDEFHARNTLPDDLSLVLKIDVESCEQQVLTGAELIVSKKRPIIFLEILPESDLAYYYQWMNRHEYNHFHLLPPNQIIPDININPSLLHRDHLFAPKELDLYVALGTQMHE